MILKKQFILTLALLSLFLSGTSCAEDTRHLTLPPGFRISVFAEGLRGPRFMAFSPDGILHVTLTKADRVVALPDIDSDGSADKEITVASGMNNPHGIAFFGGHVYVAETDKVVRFRQNDATLKFHDREIIVPELPTKGGGHFTRSIAFGPGRRMYVSVGSSCNICIESDKRRASVLRFDPIGNGSEIFAEGLRNAVGIAFDPATGELYGTENGRDWLGDDLPPDEINIIRKGRHYGWPYCYGQRIPDPEYDEEKFCEATEPPVAEIQAHSAPLGLTFYTGKAFPERYRGRLFVALHGSWNRSIPTGYKVISFQVKDGKISGTYEDFITGWFRGNVKWGRPVDIVQDSKGNLFISDDYGGRIYLVSHEKRAHDP